MSTVKGEKRTAGEYTEVSRKEKLRKGRGLALRGGRPSKKLGFFRRGDQGMLTNVVRGIIKKGKDLLTIVRGGGGILDSPTKEKQQRGGGSNGCLPRVSRTHQLRGSRQNSRLSTGRKTYWKIQQ